MMKFTIDEADILTRGILIVSIEQKSTSITVIIAIHRKVVIKTAIPEKIIVTSGMI